MARRCSVTGKGVGVGNNVSHANNKTRRRFCPNLQRASFMSEKLGVSIQLRLAASTIKTIDKNGGLDNFLLGTPNSRLTAEAAKLKKQIVRATGVAG